MSAVVVLTPQELQDIILAAHKEGALRMKSLLEEQKSKIDWEQVPNFLTVAKAADISGMHRDTVLSKVKEGKINATPIQCAKYTKYYIPRLEFKRFLEQKR